MSLEEEGGGSSGQSSWVRPFILWKQRPRHKALERSLLSYKSGKRVVRPADWLTDCMDGCRGVIGCFSQVIGFLLTLNGFFNWRLFSQENCLKLVKGSILGKERRCCYCCRQTPAASRSSSDMHWFWRRFSNIDYVFSFFLSSSTINVERLQARQTDD